MKSWIDEVKQADVSAVAAALGLQSTRGNAVKPCPACNAEQRGSADRRGPVGLRPDGTGWRCFRCDASGDAPELASYKLHGCSLRDLDSTKQKDLRQRLHNLGFCSDSDGKEADRKTWTVRRAIQKPQAAAFSGGGAFAWRDDLAESCAAALWTEKGRGALEYLRGRGFPDEALKHWKIGAHFEHSGDRVVAQYVTIPVMDENGKPINIRFRSVPGVCMRCGGEGCGRCKEGQVRKVYLRSPGRPTTLYGVHQLDRDTGGEVIIAEGELDVIALWALGFRRNVVSGTAGAGHWEDEWLDTL